MRGGRWMIAGAVAALVLGGATPAARAQASRVCGDPDRTGAPTVTDGAQILFRAAQLGSSCTPDVCDVDGNGQVGVTDAVNVLAFAAGLPATLTCGTETGDFISRIEAEPLGTAARLEIGPAPIPAAGAPVTIGTVDGRERVAPGVTQRIEIPFDFGGTAQAAQQTGGSIIVAVLRESEAPPNFETGYFVLRTSATSGEIVLNVTYSPNLGQETFLFCPATRQDGELSQYGVLRQVPE